MHYQIKKFLGGLLITSLFAFNIPDADARGRVKFRSSGVHHGKNHSDSVMSRDELRACQAYEKQLNAKHAEVEILAG